ncbi:MAG: prepilin peptidase [Roseiarcus sp.]|jgi:prepilin peptidase CpaA
MAAAILIPATIVFFPAAMALAASMDLVTMTIPNRVCAALAIGYLVLAVAVGVPFGVILIHLSCAAAVLIVMFAMFALGWIGGGDAKLAAATSLWLGWGVMFEYGATAALYGGALTLVILLGRGFVLPTWLSRCEWIARLHDRKTGVPYGVALAAAGIMLYPHTQIWQAAASL